MGKGCGSEQPEQSRGTLADGGPLENPPPWALRPILNAQAPHLGWASSLHVDPDIVQDLLQPQGERKPCGGPHFRHVGRWLGAAPYPGAWSAVCCVLEAEVDTGGSLFRAAQRDGADTP